MVLNLTSVRPLTQLQPSGTFQLTFICFCKYSFRIKIRTCELCYNVCIVFHKIHGQGSVSFSQSQTYGPQDIQIVLRTCHYYKTDDTYSMWCYSYFKDTPRAPPLVAPQWEMQNLCRPCGTWIDLHLNPDEGLAIKHSLHQKHREI